MTETQRRIRAYKRALPELRERVVAVALLLAMSASMLASASFAWLTISRRPEVTGVNTTVAANGNLEIALATGNGVTAPGESQVGDSSAREDQSVTASNITWGNLVNLSDESYGLENMTLRPAQLNTSSLLDSPLYGAVYNADGRITQLTSNFGYATWNMPQGDKPGYFGVSDTFGVRAISSTHIEAVGADAIYAKMCSEAKNTNLSAANTYANLGNNKQYMQSLATMMGLYMTARMNPEEASLNNPDLAIEDIQNLRDMYAAFLDCFDMEAEAMAALANLRLFLAFGDGAYTPYTKEMIYATNEAALKAEGIQVTNLNQFIKDRNIILSDLEKLSDICSSGQNLKWTDSGINNIVNNLVDVGKCTIGANNTPISSIGASNAMSYLSGTQEARITNGILYRFEERTGGYIQVKELSISASVKRMGITIPATVKANIQTTAPRDYNLFSNDQKYTESLNTGDYQGGEAVAQDTYGLAIDLWVRTNASDSYLTLEGNVLTEKETVRATGKDPENNVVELYTLTRTDTDEEGNSMSYSYDLYKQVTKDESGAETTTWYNANTHFVFTLNEADGQQEQPLEKWVEVTTVIGYEGENRIWDKDAKQLSTDATTQGSGSCYVYYADTPEDQARSLKLLEAFNVAFVNVEGRLIGSAIMDTENYFAENGRVIVPLVLDPSSSINLGEDYQGEVTYAIAPLEQNVPTRITALVYLNGTKLDNDDVLSAAAIQGQLNIQFGSNAAMEPIENENLQNQILKVSASADKTSFDWDTATEPMTTNVTVHVDGSEPSTVEAFFLRKISDSQGSRENVMTFTKNASGDWVSSYTFNAPGNYILRTVRLDGVDYDLEVVPEVKVTGFTIKSLSCVEADGGRHIDVLTAAGSTTAKLNLQFATDDPNKMPKEVQGRYLREDGSAVNVNFSYNATTHIWSGTATFHSSGEYVMDYLVLDDKYVELDSGMRQTASITLGMRVAVYTTSPHSFKYLPTEMTENQKNLAMQVKVMDNTGKELPGRNGVKLTYNMKGSAVKKMDADLTWNGTYYVGELPNGGAGIWQFSYVEVGSNILNTATTAPTFTILSPEPPEYYGQTTIAYQYKPNNDSMMSVQITNSAAASIQAYIIKKGATDGTWVTGAIGQEFTTDEGKPANYWNFVVPKDANGYQDGNWQLTTLKLWDVFAADGTPYTQESPLEIDVSNTNNVTKSVNRIYVTFPEGQSKDFGKDASGNVTAAFMTSHTISGLSVGIKDFENNLETKISDVQLKFKYTSNSCSTYGGYTSEELAKDDIVVTVKLEDIGNGQFAQNEAAALVYAGAYTTELSFKVNGTTVTYSGDKLPATAPKYTVSSVAPTVKIVNAYYGNSSSENPATFTNTSTTVTKYQYEGTCGVTNYKQPYVVIALAGCGNATSTSLSFVRSGGGDVELYSENGGKTATDKYEWTSNGNCTRYVGYWGTTTGNDTYRATGTLVADKLNLTFNNITFAVDVDNITINNPS